MKTTYPSRALKQHKVDSEAYEKARKLALDLLKKNLEKQVNDYIDINLEPELEKADKSGALGRYVAADKQIRTARYIRDNIILSQK